MRFQEGIIFLLFLTIIDMSTVGFKRSLAEADSSSSNGLHAYSLEDLSGATKKLSDYKGKVVLMENVATL